MKKMLGLLLFALVMLLSILSTANAAPFVACDVQQEIEWYEITGLPAPLDVKNGTKLVPTVKEACDDGKPCSTILDLGTLPVNAATTLKLQVRPCNIRGCSTTWVPFNYVLPALPTTVTNIRLTK
jgi:hypothetical protein